MILKDHDEMLMDAAQLLSDPERAEPGQERRWGHVDKPGKDPQNQRSRRASPGRPRGGHVSLKRGHEPGAPPPPKVWDRKGPLMRELAKSRSSPGTENSDASGLVADL